MLNDEFLYVEKYRPTTVEECILPDSYKEKFLDFVKEGDFPHLLLSGTPGVGKTTVAKALCNQLDMNYLVINSSDERGIDTLRSKVKQFASTMSFDRRKKAIILDEADNITSDAQDALRGVMEQFSNNCKFILTANFKAKIKPAIQSRCLVIDFDIKEEDKLTLETAFFWRCESILKENGVDYDKRVLAALIARYFPDFRRTLNELQGLAMNGKIDVGVLSNVSGSLAKLVAHMKAKDFNAIRTWVHENDLDSATLFTRLYDILSDELVPVTLPSAVLVLAKYQYQAAFVADQELNNLACIVELLVEVEFK